MPTNDIEISSNGLKLSYLRFLADGAVGVAVIMILVLAYYFKIPIPLRLGHQSLHPDWG